MLQPLESSGYVDDAVEALHGANVYVSREVPGAAQLADTLEVQVGDASIGVAVFSDNVSLEASNDQILSQLAETSGYDTIIVAVGDDLFAGSRVLEPGEAMRIANQAEGAAGSVDAALVQTVQQIEEALPVGGSSGADAAIGIWVAVGVGALVAAGAAAVFAVRARRRRGRRHPLPEPVRATVTRLRGLVGEYSVAAARGVAGAGEVADEVAGITATATELFERLSRKSDETQSSTAAIEYGDTLRKLAMALDRDYLLDILSHPDLWDDPAERVAEVREAVAAVRGELVENIKQVNARRGLHFQVSLDGLMGRRKELREWERAFDEADDRGAGPQARGD